MADEDAERRRPDARGGGETGADGQQMGELKQRPFPPGDDPAIVVGSGPGGLQLSYFLTRARRWGMPSSLLKSSQADSQPQGRSDTHVTVCGSTSPPAARRLPLRSQVGVEERHGSLAGVDRGSPAVAGVGEAAGDTRHVGISPGAWSLRKACPASGVDLDVVFDPVGGEGGLKLSGGRAQRAVSAAVAGHDRTGVDQHRVGVVNRAVVHPGGGVVVRRGEQHGESAAEAVPDDADLAGAVVTVGDPVVGGFEVFECASALGGDGLRG